MIIKIIRFRNGLSLPGWLRKMSIQYLQNIPQGQVQLLAFTWQNHLEQAGEWAKGKKLAPSNQCSG